MPGGEGEGKKGKEGMVKSGEEEKREYYVRKETRTKRGGGIP